MLPHHPSSPALADAKAIAKHRDRSARSDLWCYSRAIVRFSETFVVRAAPEAVFDS
jgi:hypothetical protein